MTAATHTPGSVGAGGDWHEAWSIALEALELDVVEAERLLALGRPAADANELMTGVAAWSPPRLAGPLPVELRARAEAILARQLRVADDLVRAMGSNRREVQVARKMNSGSVDRTRPVFVDSQM